MLTAVYMKKTSKDLIIYVQIGLHKFHYLNKLVCIKIFMQPNGPAVTKYKTSQIHCD